MTRTLFCLSPFQAWTYHSNCDIQAIENIADGYVPDKILIITCSGGLLHCDLRENIQLATKCSEEHACKICCSHRNNYMSQIQVIANSKHIKLERIDIQLKLEDFRIISKTGFDLPKLN